MSTTNKDSEVLYDENKRTPTDINNTAQASVNNTDDSVITSDNQSTPKGSLPNTTTDPSKSATGSGLSAAQGTEYSWDTKASDRANLSYESAVLEAKSNYLTNRQDIETQGQQYQQQLDMQKYATNQSNEKAGWTGGYILDTERQMSYLKQTIQSQMYGAMELQKYGYDTSLAAARLAYDTNKYDLALEYYNTALSRAVSEAEITGYYVSPETSEMLNEYSIASRIMNDETIPADDPEKIRADKILASVYEWFEANGISKQGVETYSHIVEERTHKMSIDKLYTYINDAQNQISTDTFAKLDEEGNKIYTDSGIETLDFSKMDGAALKEYITNKDGSINEVKRDQYYSRLDSLSYEMENNFITYCKKQGFIDEQGNTNITNYRQTLVNYLNEVNLADKLTSELNRLNTKDTELLNNLIDNWECDIALPDGSEVTLKLTREGTQLFNKTINGKPSNITESITDNSKITQFEMPDGTLVTSATMQPQKTAAQVINLLQTENYSNLFNAIYNIDVESSKDISVLLGQILGGAAEAYGVGAGIATGVAAAKAAGGALTYGTIAGAGASAALSATGWGALFAIAIDTGISWGTDFALADDMALKKEQLDNIAKGLVNSIGKHNIDLLKSAYDEWNSMDDYNKNLMAGPQKEMYEKAAKFYENYSTILQAIDYCSRHDSNLFDSDLFEYTGDMFARIPERWDDGYQFGDGIGTVLDVCKGIVTGVGECILAVVGKGWLW